MTTHQILEQHILDMIDRQSEKSTPNDLVNLIRRQFPFKRAEILSTVKTLMTKNHLAYTQEYGRTFVERSFHGPVRLSDRVIVKPPGMAFDAKPDDIVIDIAAGASFGSGCHPTTRLAVKGIEHVFALSNITTRPDQQKVLDIGTGSGILAITGLKMGMDHATGTDTDPCARYEAMQNARLNGLENRFVISDPDSIRDESFNLITANLRTPTLKQILPAIRKMLLPDGTVVVSGIRTDETKGIEAAYTKAGFTCIRKNVEKGWAGMVFVVK